MGYLAYMGFQTIVQSACWKRVACRHVQAAVQMFTCIHADCTPGISVHLLRPVAGIPVYSLVSSAVIEANRLTVSTVG